MTIDRPMITKPCKHCGKDVKTVAGRDACYVCHFSPNKRAERQLQSEIKSQRERRRQLIVRATNHVKANPHNRWAKARLLRLISYDLVTALKEAAEMAKLKRGQR